MQIRVLQSQNEIYQKQRLLGQGAFGKAYLVRKKQTNQYLVIKEVNIDHMSKQQREQTIKEAQILQNLRHPLIVKFIEVYATKQNKLKIVMEYAECGDLSKAIAAKKSEKKNFTESQILDWFTQICLAMKHVHDRKILHRDIKGQNIFITKTNILKLGDFGIARVLNKTQDKARTVVGTPYYLSPEIIQNKPYSFKSDVWSMGVLLYELCALNPPFTGASLQFLALKIVKGSYSSLPGNYSKDIKGLISEMLQIDSYKRPSVGDILNKSFIRERITKYLSETRRIDEFSHTILHNHKVQIANKLIKVQDGNKDNKIEIQRNRLKEQAAILKQKLERKKEQERQQERKRRKEEERLRKQQQSEKRREQNQKIRELEQKRAIEQRKQWIQRENKKQQQNKLYKEQQKRRIEANEIARRRERQAQQLMVKKERLMQQKYQFERERALEFSSKKKIQKQKDQAKKIEQINQFARKQWYENQMIRKRAEERARQSEYQNTPEPSYEQEPKPISRPQTSKDKSNANNRKQSHEKEKPLLAQYGNKKYSVQLQQFDQQISNALLNPNYPRKAPSSAQQQKSQSRLPVTAMSEDQKMKQQIKLMQENKNVKRYADERQKIKRDRQQFMNNNKKEQISIPVVQTLKPGKWQRMQSRSSQKQLSKQKKPEIQQAKKITPFQSDNNQERQQIRLSVKDQQQYNDYLKQLQGFLVNQDKNIQRLNPPEQLNQKNIIFREEDDNEDLDYSLTASFKDILKIQQQVDAKNADFDLFVDYSKLEGLRMKFQDLFGTNNFIRIYRILESQLQSKGLENINNLQSMPNFGNSANKLIQENLPLLLTLIVMEQKLSFS